MNADSSGSASSTGTTPASAAANTPKARNESEFLHQRAVEARQAMARSVKVIGARLGNSADPRAWTRSHPWISISGAAAGGFVAVSLLFPSQQRRVMRRLKAIERAARRQADAQDRAAAAAIDGSSAPDEERGGTLKWLMGETFRIVRPALMSAIFGALSAAATDEAEANSDVQGAAGDPEPTSDIDQGPSDSPGPD